MFLVATAVGVEFGIANKVGSRRILVNIGFLVYLMMTLFGGDFLLCWLTHIAVTVAITRQ
jgi:hypothetical protein